MYIINSILFLFFLVIAGLGVAYSVEAGIFVGFSFAPWQLFQLEFRKKGYLLFSLLSWGTGIYFLFDLNSSWPVKLLFVFLGLLNTGKYFLNQQEIDGKVEEEENKT